MDNFDTDFLVAQQIQAFENLETFSVSNDWEVNLDLKLKQVKRSSYSLRKHHIVFGFLTLINIGFILFTIVKMHNNIYSRAQDLNIITSELLIPEKN